MALIRANCAVCTREAQLDSDQVLLVIRPEGDHVCTFTCGACGHASAQTVGADAVLRLSLAGVTCVAGEPEPHDPDAPAMTLDDLIELHALLGAPGWFDRLQALTTAAGPMP